MRDRLTPRIKDVSAAAGGLSLLGTTALRELLAAESVKSMPGQTGLPHFAPKAKPSSLNPSPAVKISDAIVFADQPQP